MRRFRFFFATAALVSLALLALPLGVHADVNDFTVNDFVGDYTLSRTDPQGTLHVIEQLSVTFTDYNHGILRAIPKSYKGQSLHLTINKVSSESGAPAQYTTYTSNGNEVLKIGDPSRTVTGAQEYTIDYTVDDAVSFYTDHDELYWDINGDQWGQPFEHVSATFHLPAGAQQWRTPVCYAGSSGSNGTACSVARDGTTLTATTTAPLTANQTLTVVAGFNKGYFQPPNFWKNLLSHWQILVGLIGIPLFVAFFSWLVWWKRGRDADVGSVIIPEYGPPPELGILEVGAIYDFKVGKQDLSAVIIDLAIRKYIRIIETTESGVLGMQQAYSFQLLTTDWSTLTVNEDALLKGLFETAVVGTVVKLNENTSALAVVGTSISQAVEEDLTKRSYFHRNPLKSGTILVSLSGIVIGIAFVSLGSLGPAVLVGLALSAIIMYIFSTKMPARTVKGVTARNHILGLKLYLQVAEKERIAKLQAPNAPYASNDGEPVKTVELFEKLLPYAMVLGVEQQWAKQFESLYTQPPDWYSGNWTAFNVGYFAGNLNSSFVSSVNAAFATPSSSGGSGFGGGFSGGGGGGGGGGGW